MLHAATLETTPPAVPSTAAAVSPTSPAAPASAATAFLPPLPSSASSLPPLGPSSSSEVAEKISSPSTTAHPGTSSSEPEKNMVTITTPSIPFSGPVPFFTGAVAKVDGGAEKLPSLLSTLQTPPQSQQQQQPHPQQPQQMQQLQQQMQQQMQQMLLQHQQQQPQQQPQQQQPVFQMIPTPQGPMWFMPTAFPFPQGQVPGGENNTMPGTQPMYFLSPQQAFPQQGVLDAQGPRLLMLPMPAMPSQQSMPGAPAGFSPFPFPPHMAPGFYPMGSSQIGSNPVNPLTTLEMAASMSSLVASQFAEQRKTGDSETSDDSPSPTPEKYKIHLGSKKTGKKSRRITSPVTEEDKVHVCTYPGCKTRFLRPEHLKRHWRIHTGERPFGCHICGRFFSRSDNLKSHLLLHKKSQDDGEVHEENDSEDTPKE